MPHLVADHAQQVHRSRLDIAEVGRGIVAAYRQRHGVGLVLVVVVLALVRPGHRTGEVVQHVLGVGHGHQVVAGRETFEVIVAVLIGGSCGDDGLAGVPGLVPVRVPDQVHADAGDAGLTGIQHAVLAEVVPHGAAEAGQVRAVVAEVGVQILIPSIDDDRAVRHRRGRRVAGRWVVGRHGVAAGRELDLVEAVLVRGVADGAAAAGRRGADLDAGDARLARVAQAIAVAVIPDGVADDGLAGPRLLHVAEVRIPVDLAWRQGDRPERIGLALGAGGMRQAGQRRAGLVHVHEVDADRQAGEDVAAVYVGNLSAHQGIGCGVEDVVAVVAIQAHRHIADARLAHILDAVGVGVVPDVVADGAGQQVTEVGGQVAPAGGQDDGIRLGLVVVVLPGVRAQLGDAVTGQDAQVIGDPHAVAAPFQAQEGVVAAGAGGRRAIRGIIFPEFHGDAVLAKITVGRVEEAIPIDFDPHLVADDALGRGGAAGVVAKIGREHVGARGERQGIGINLVVVVGIGGAERRLDEPPEHAVGVAHVHQVVARRHAGEQVVAVVGAQCRVRGQRGDDRLAALPGLVPVRVADQVHADAAQRRVAGVEDAVLVGVQEHQVADGAQVG